MFHGSVLLWAIGIGLISSAISFFIKYLRSPIYLVIYFLTIASTVYAWNWMIEYTRAIIYLNVDHPILRISWADFFDGITVMALCNLVMGFVLRNEKAYILLKITIVAFITTVLVDIFLF